METVAPKIAFHVNVLPRQTKKAFDFLATQNWLKKSGWYLAGGTALELHAGHRKSLDLDFFTDNARVKSTEVLNHFKDNENWHTDINKENTIYGKLFKAKISFVAYPFFIPKQDYTQYGTIKILKPTDIAVMKIIAISQRGKKRDFFDL